MPQIVAVVVAYAVEAFAVVVGKTLAVLIVNTIIKLAITVAISAAMRALQPKPRAMQQGTILQTKLDPAYPREVAVGKFATGGSLAFENVSGSKNDYLWRVIVISDAEIEEISQVRGNGEALTFSGDIHTGLRACTSHFQGPHGDDCLYIRVYKGTSGQTADADLLAAFPSLLDSNFRLRGCAYVLMKLWWNSDAWSSGGEFVFVGKGAKVLDPRTGTTAWSENAALISRAYLKGFENNGIRVVGLGASDSDLPDAAMNSAADVCDEAVSLAAGGTEARYRAGGILSGRANAREIMTDLMGAMAGRHIDDGGQIVLLPGNAQTPVLDVAENDLLADAGIVWAGRKTSDERVNCIASTFVSPDDGWQEAPLPPRKATARITADGARYEENLAYAMVYSKTQGQRLDQIELNRSGKEGVFVCAAPLWAFELSPGDWVTATNKRWGNAQKTFEVVTQGLTIVSGMGGGQPQARCALTLQEVDPLLDAWSTSDELTFASAINTMPAALVSRFDNDGRLNGAIANGNPNITGATAYRTPASPLTATDAGTTATISIAAHTLKTSDANGVSVSAAYNSGSITGLAFSTSYFVFAHDVTFAGGAVTYVASTTSDTYITNNEYVFVDAITTPADGGGPTSPPPPPPHDCVSVDAWLDLARQARDVEAGALICVLCDDCNTYEQACVDGAYSVNVDAMRLYSSSGVRLTMSATTPITQPSGMTVLARNAIGCDVAVIDATGFRWEKIVRVDHAGVVPVRRIHVGGRTYAAGDEPGRLMFTHNPIKP